MIIIEIRSKYGDALLHVRVFHGLCSEVSENLVELVDLYGLRAPQVTP